jgi:hypothetical protein
MRKELLYVLAVILVFLILAFWYYQYQKAHKTETKFEILVATDSPLDTLGTAIEFAFSSLLQEEGIPFRLALRDDIFKFKPQEIVDHNPVIIFPDYISQKIPAEFEVWITEYVELGGNVFITYDSGIRMRNGRYRDKAIYSSLLGLNYITYDKYTDKSYQLATVQFKDQNSADFFQIPYGKMDENLTITGYGYGPLEYPVARIEVSDVSNDEIYAYSVYQDGSRSPNIVVKEFEKGSLVYTNLPLGYLKAYASDEFLLRSVIRTYLFKIVKIPHLSNMPAHKGGLVMNWHVDNNKEWQNISWLEKKGFLKSDFPISCHIAAGPWLEKENDNLGFDARNHRNLVKKLANFGEIGSLGGWAHNWFARKIANNELLPLEIEQSIQLNIDVLAEITDKPIREFSAPRGIYLPLFTRIIEKNGIFSHSYLGDSGSLPNRAFINGKRFSDRVFAFPVMSYRAIATTHEFGIERIPAADFEKWLSKTLDYLVTNHALTLIYSHFYDFRDYPQYVPPFQRFMEKALQLQNAGKLIIKPMSYFSRFQQRILKTKVDYLVKKDNLLISVSNPESLRDIVLCLPKEDFRKTTGIDLEVTEDDNFYYLRFSTDKKQQLITARYR